MSTILDRNLAVLGLVSFIAWIAWICWEAGVGYGKELADQNLWKNPPGMEWCRVYSDGSKHCEPKLRKESCK